MLDYLHISIQSKGGIMKTLILTAVCLLMLIGCTTYKPVTSMSDWQLKSEYSDLQIKQRQLEREMMYGGLDYTTRSSYQPPPPTNNFLANPAGGLALSSAGDAFARGLGNTSTTTTHNPAIDKLNKVENRMREVENEILSRQIRGNQNVTPQSNYSPTTKPQSGPVYSTKYSRLFHRSGCSQLNSKDSGLISFSSRENAKKNGGKPCSGCNP